MVSERLNMLLKCLLMVAACLPGAYTYAMYGEQIPNGDHVPHPCKANFIWHGVGHTNSQGGGERNPFGEDFAANGREWTEALCKKDSDGDGRSNGEELGDPDCVWSKGQIPPITKGITHPGVCEPYNEGQCITRNAWLDCSRHTDFECEHINSPDVINVTLRFPRTKVPAKETTYICYNFQLPDDQEYHLIASKPYIDNNNIMHHMVMSGCTESVGMVDAPYECLMGSEGCYDILAIWSVGITGTCIHPQAGFKVGKGNYRTVSLQMHWTNPGLNDEWFDSSGLILYLTPKLRQYNAGIITIGQTYLSIPPGKSSWVHEGICSSYCTNRFFTGDIHIFTSFNHMHYLGVRQNITLNRPATAVQMVSEDNPFRYDTPKLHLHDPPVLVKPGDELTTMCTFQSRSRTSTTMYGEGSFEEMCFAFLSYFPKESVINSYCTQYEHLDMCDMYEKCDETIFNSSNPSTVVAIKKILDNCDPAGTCREECPAAINEVKSSNNCLRNMWSYVLNNIYTHIKDPALYKMAAALQSCDDKQDTAVTTRPEPPVTMTPPTARPQGSGSSTKVSNPHDLLLSLVKSVDARPLLQNIIMNINYNNADNDHDAGMGNF